MPDTRRIDHQEIWSAIDRIVEAIKKRPVGPARILLLGIANGGIALAQRIGALVPNAGVGTLDISFHRDDIHRNPIPKEFSPTIIPGDVNGAHVILIDDVLFSGRTVKAALDELFDHGRPATVELAVLVDRGGRKLPIAADFCGLKIETTSTEKVVVKLDATDPRKDEIIIRSASAS